MLTRLSNRTPSGTATHTPSTPAEGTTPSHGLPLPDLALDAAKAVQKNVRRAATGMLGLSGVRMSKVDTAWLRMDSPSNLMMINGVWTVSPGITLAALRERMQERLLQYPRFRQRVVEDPAGATWVDDQRFDIDAHVQAAKLPRRRGQSPQDALRQFVGDLATKPLDPKRPLWHFYLVEDFTGDDGLPSSALVVRMHHCIADGIALISVTMSIVDGGTEPPKRRKKGPGGAEDWIADTLIKPFTGMTVKALDLVGESAAKSLHLLLDPEKAVQHGLAGSADAARLGYQLVSDAASLALMPDDSPTGLKGVPGTQKRVAWCPPLPLDEVKAIGKALLPTLRKYSYQKARFTWGIGKRYIGRKVFLQVTIKKKRGPTYGNAECFCLFRSYHSRFVSSGECRLLSVFGFGFRQSDGIER